MCIQPKWVHPPFSAYKDENGRIFARGASDMKPTTVATLEAIRSLKKAGYVPRRSIHVAIFPGYKTRRNVHMLRHKKVGG